MLANASELLLYALSARGQMPLGEFNAAFDQLVRLPAGDDETRLRFAHSQAGRLLDSLGHCEYDGDRRRVAVCAPALALLPSSGLPRALLTGARDQELVQRLRAWVGARPADCTCAELPQPVAVSGQPVAITVEAVLLETLAALAIHLGVGFDATAPAAWLVLHAAAGLDEVVSAANFEPRAELTGWVRRYFSGQKWQFGPDPDPSPAPYRLVLYNDPRTHDWRTWVWAADGQQAASVGRDWGRYFVLRAAGQQVLRYDPRFHLLAVPETLPLPALLARALTLCAGLVPLTVRLPATGRDYLLYKLITPAIAEGVAARLGQRLVPDSLAPFLPSATTPTR